ncbi:MAG TPA: hypothetical protein VH500_22045 [Nitrososphaeraceae archaeon]|jgi:DNA-binding PadR family transcriptional regulator
MTRKKYNYPLGVIRPKKTNTRFTEDEFEILELLAQEKSRTIMDVTNAIKNSKIQRDYKNVYYLVQKLRSYGLIEEEANVERTRRRRNKRYYKLTDEGIYQLFLNLRYHGILADQMLVRKGKEPVSHISNFMKYYGNNIIFEKFLYPYFEKQTIYSSNIHFLTRLFKFVHDCCKQSDLGDKIPYMIPQFSWNKVPGENDKELLTSIREVFEIDNLDNAIIAKSPDGNAIKLTASKLSIVIKLEKTEGKAIATKESNTEPKKYEYKILNYFSELTAFRPKINNGRFDSTRLVEMTMYDLVTDIGSTSARTQQEDIIRLLAKDTKFMNVVEEIHTRFTNGYNRLMAIRKNS